MITLEASDSRSARTTAHGITTGTSSGRYRLRRARIGQSRPSAPLRNTCMQGPWTWPGREPSPPVVPKGVRITMRVNACRGPRLQDSHPHRLVRRDVIADVTHQYQRATAGDRTPGIPALPRPNGGDHLARCRIDHGAAVDHHGRDRLVTASHRANESGRIGIPPDVDLPDGKMMPPQDKAQPPAEHTARPPVQGDPGRGTGLLAGWAHQAIQPLVISPRPRDRASPAPSWRPGHRRVPLSPRSCPRAVPGPTPPGHSADDRASEE